MLVRAPSGRQRFTVLGALHAISHQRITVTNESYLKARSVCELLEKIAARGLSTPMTLVMEKARYQRCRLVVEMATALGMELLFLPTDSPNLNLIERLGKFVRKECLYSTSYERFDAFKQAITQCLAETTGRHQAALNRLLTLEFQTFESASRDR